MDPNSQNRPYFLLFFPIINHLLWLDPLSTLIAPHSVGKFTVRVSKVATLPLPVYCQVKAPGLLPVRASMLPQSAISDWIEHPSAPPDTSNVHSLDATACDFVRRDPLLVAADFAYLYLTPISLKK